MQRLLTIASTHYLERDSSPVTASGQVVAGMAWVRPTVVNVLQVVTYLGDKDSASTYYRLQISSAGLPQLVSRLAGGTETTLSGTAITAAAWHLLAWKIAANEGTLYLSVNGAAWTSTTTTNAGIFAVCDRISWGRSGDSSPGSYYGGALGPGGIWRGADLPIASVLAVRNGLSVSRISPIHRAGVWTFRANGTDLEQDYSSGGRSLTPSASIPATANGPPVGTARRDNSFSWARGTYTPPSPPPPPPPPPGPGIVSLVSASPVLYKKQVGDLSVPIEFAATSVAATSTMLIALVAVQPRFAGCTVASVEYGGQSMTRRAPDHYQGDQNAVSVTCWSLATPPTGTPSVLKVTPGTGSEYWSGAARLIGLKGVDPTVVVRAYSQAARTTSSSTSPSVQVSALANEVVTYLAALQGNDGGTATVTWTGAAGVAQPTAGGSSATTDITAVSAYKAITTAGSEAPLATWAVSDGAGAGVFVIAPLPEGETDPTSPPPPPPPPSGNVSEYWSNQGASHTVVQGDHGRGGARGRIYRMTMGRDGPVIEFWLYSQASRNNARDGIVSSENDEMGHTAGDNGLYTCRVLADDGNGNPSSTVLASFRGAWYPGVQAPENDGGFDARDRSLGRAGNPDLNAYLGTVDEAKVRAWLIRRENGYWLGAGYVSLPLYAGNGSTSERWVAENGQVVHVEIKNIHSDYARNYSNDNNGVGLGPPLGHSGRFTPYDPMLGVWQMKADGTRGSLTGTMIPNCGFEYSDGKCYGNSWHYAGGGSSGSRRNSGASIVNASSHVNEIIGNVGFRMVWTPTDDADMPNYSHMLVHAARSYRNTSLTGTGRLQMRIRRKLVNFGDWETVQDWTNCSASDNVIPATVGGDTVGISITNFTTSTPITRTEMLAAMGGDWPFLECPLPGLSYQFGTAHTWAFEIKAPSGVKYEIQHIRSSQSFFASVPTSTFARPRSRMNHVTLPRYGSSGRNYNRAEWCTNLAAATPVWSAIGADYLQLPIRPWVAT